MNIDSFITNLRKSDKYIEIIYMNGGCYQFHLLLKSLFDCKAYITADKSHIVSKYNNKYYDIKGEFTEEIPTKLTEKEKSIAEKWSFHKHCKLKITDCPFCEEPLCI